MRLSARGIDALSLVSGASLALAFAPFRLSPLALVAPALLFLAWRASPAGRAAWRGFLFGLGLFGVGVSWVYVSLHEFGNMPAPLAGFAVLLFCAVLALYPALAGWLQARYLAGVSDAVRLLLALPGLWVLFEWLRGWLFTGFPWLDLGYSQVPGPLSGLAPWVGVYGVSLATAVGAGALAFAATARRRWRVSAAVLATIVLGGWLAGRVHWVHPVGQPIRVALIQGDVPLQIKWDPGYRDLILDRYLQASESQRDVDLIVWPEAAIPMPLDEVSPEYLARLRAYARRTHADFLIGVVEREFRDGRAVYYNSVIDVGNHPGVYRKHHLVPFGEYLPLKPVFGWLLRSLQIPMSDFTPGPADQPPLRAAGQKIGVSVCYEDAFAADVIRPLPEATLLANVSEDAWFGNSFAPHQRLQMARMRALEAGRLMLRAANTGPSAVIDYNGRILARSPEFQAFVLRASVQPMGGSTPFVRTGNAPAILAALALTLAGLVRRRR